MGARATLLGQLSLLSFFISLCWREAKPFNSRASSQRSLLQSLHDQSQRGCKASCQRPATCHSLPQKRFTSHPCAAQSNPIMCSAVLRKGTFRCCPTALSSTFINLPGFEHSPRGFKLRGMTHSHLGRHPQAAHRPIAAQTLRPRMLQQ